MQERGGEGVRRKINIRIWEREVIGIGEHMERVNKWRKKVGVAPLTWGYLETPEYTHNYNGSGEKRTNGGKRFDRKLERIYWTEDYASTTNAHHKKTITHHIIFLTNGVACSSGYRVCQQPPNCLSRLKTKCPPLPCSPFPSSPVTRLSWPVWPGKCRDSIPAKVWSPIAIGLLTGLDVA